VAEIMFCSLSMRKLILFIYFNLLYLSVSKPHDYPNMYSSFVFFLKTDSSVFTILSTLGNEHVKAIEGGIQEALMYAFKNVLSWKNLQPCFLCWNW